MGRRNAFKIGFFLSFRVLILRGSLWLAAIASPCRAQGVTYLGFDRNEYPGDANLKTLRQTFSYTGYWLNNPPGATSNLVGRASRGG